MRNKNKKETLTLKDASESRNKRKGKNEDNKMKGKIHPSSFRLLPLNRPPISKEHGSWAMLIVPLLLGTIIAPVWHWRTLLLFVAAVGFFLSRYPLSILVRKRKRDQDKRAYLLRWTAIYAGITALSGGWLVFAERLWLLALMGVIGALLVAFNLWLIANKKQMSLMGELSGIAGLALGAPMAYYVASGYLDQTAIILWLLNALYFGGTVFYIKLKVRQQPKQPAPDKISKRLIRAKACLAYHTTVLILVFALVTLQKAPALTPLAFIPVMVKVFRGAVNWQDKKTLSLVRLGFTELFHSAAFMILVIVAFK